MFLSFLINKNKGTGIRKITYFTEASRSSVSRIKLGSVLISPFFAVALTAVLMAGDVGEKRDKEKKGVKEEKWEGKEEERMGRGRGLLRNHFLWEMNRTASPRQQVAIPGSR